jgi:hypothetical protein
MVQPEFLRAATFSATTSTPQQAKFPASLQYFSTPPFFVP